MGEFCDWIRDLAGYLIFLAALEQLQPEKQEVNGVRLFAGIVFLLLAVRPLADGTGFAGRMAGIYRELELQSDARSLEKEVSGAGEKQRERLFAVYEQAVSKDVQRVAGELGLAVQEAEISICRDGKSERFGTVTYIRVTLLSADSMSAPGSETDAKLAKLRLTLRSCYHLEDADVEIGTVAGKG